MTSRNIIVGWANIRVPRIQDSKVNMKVQMAMSGITHPNSNYLHYNLS